MMQPNAAPQRPAETDPAGGIPLPDAADPHAADALRRLLSQYQDGLERDPVTGLHNRRHLCAALAGKAPSAVAVRVAEYAAIAAQGPAAAQSCLNVAAGILGTALDPAWDGAGVARWQDGTFVAVACVPAETLLAAVQTAIQNGRLRYAASLSRRGSFTMAAAAADAAEAAGFDAVCDLALERLAAL